VEVIAGPLPPACNTNIADCISLLWIFGGSRVDAGMCP
jgi:hypothetical protein